MSQKIPKLSPLAVKMSAALKIRLKNLAEQRQRSTHWLMLKAIEQYVSQEEYVERLKQETLARWQEAEQGRIVGNDTVMAWLDTWGTDKETERPPCDK